MKPWNKAQKERASKIAEMGCIICASPATIHHCGTYMGGGRNHDRILPLCWEHHLGRNGIDGKHMSKRQWEAKYGTEEELMRRVESLLGEV